jgi:hypothetical protein
MVPDCLWVVLFEVKLAKESGEKQVVMTWIGKQSLPKV